MIRIYTKDEIDKISKAGDIVRKCHNEIQKYLVPGITTLELDNILNNIITSSGGTAAVKGYNGYPAYTCISVNDCVVHGIPNNYQLKEGDIVSIDIVVDYEGYKADRGWTYGVGKLRKLDKKLLKETEAALYAGIAEVKADKHISNISNSIQVHARKHKYGIVEELAGHGVGKEIHEDPMIPNYGKRNGGPIMKAGMVLAIEPMLNLGDKEIYIEDDNWAVRTLDGKKSAHFEHTVLVCEHGYEILT